MVPASGDGTAVGKLIFILLLSCILGYLIVQDKAGDNLRGEQLTLEEYTAGFEAHKARLSKPPGSMLFEIGLLASFAVVLFASYELVGHLIGRLLVRAGLMDDTDDQEEPEDIPGRTDLSVSIGRAGVASLGLAPVLAAITLWPAIWIWSWQAIKADMKQTEWGLVFLAAILVGLVVHELLHGLGFVRFGGGRWKDLKFGVKLRYLAAYATIDSPLTASAYRRTTALPGVVLGIIPLLAGIALGNGWLLLYGYFNVLFAAGDLTILWMVRNVDGSAKVIDHTHRAGCWVLNDEVKEDVANTPH